MRRGQSTVELALMLPLISLLIAGTLQVGVLISDQIALNQAAYEGGLWAVANPLTATADSGSTAGTISQHIMDQLCGSAAAPPSSDGTRYCTHTAGVPDMRVTALSRTSSLAQGPTLPFVTDAYAANCKKWKLTISPLSATITAGASQAITATLSLTGQNGNDPTVTLYAGGYPTKLVNGNPTFNPPSITASSPGNVATLTIATRTDTPPGTYTISISGQDNCGGSPSAGSGSTTLTVNAPVAPSPTPTPVPAGTPTVTAVSPSSVCAGVLSSITVSGTNFVSGDTVSAGATTATTVAVASASQLTATFLPTDRRDLQHHRRAVGGLGHTGQRADRGGHLHHAHARLGHHRLRRRRRAVPDGDHDHVLRTADRWDHLGHAVPDGGLAAGGALPVSTQRGQVAPIFAIAALVMIGLIALAVDFGATANQHRFLQDTADHAALAGAARLGRAPTAVQFTDARQTAFVYMRDNLQMNLTLAAAQAVCDMNSQVSACALPAPYSNYSISISAPGETLPGEVLVSSGTTVSVRIDERLTVSFAAVVGVQGTSTQVVAIAQSVQPQYSNFAVYLDGCLDIGNHLELVAGDVYVNQCTLNFQSQNQASFCAYLTPSQAGNLVFGPHASAPQMTQSGGQTLVQCRSGTGDTISTTGAVLANPTTITPPAFSAPPGIPDCPVGGCLAATNTHACTNHTVKADGTLPVNCYAAGAYTTIGLGSPNSNTAGIANNLNPGIYYITGDTTSACYTGSQTECPAIQFDGNTINANFGTVQDTCWAAPNAPALGNFTAPCPTGFAVNPLTPVDPQCTGAAATATATPTFTVVAVNSGGTLAAGTYYVRVTAFNGLGETASTESSATVNPVVAGQGAIQVTIPFLTGATGYVVYGPATASNQEVAYPPAGATVQGPYPPPATVNQPGLGSSVVTLTSVPSGTTPYPRFANSSCAAGFHNVPRNPYENNGVTFVMTGKASLCHNGSCGTAQAGNKTPVIMLSPYCSTLSNSDLPPSGGASPCPYATTGSNINDGAFVFYGTTQGYIAASGGGSVLALTGTVYTPQAQLHIDGTSGLGYAKFQVIPGQVVMKSFDVYSGNSLEPLVYYDRVGAALPGFLRLVE